MKYIVGCMMKFNTGYVKKKVITYCIVVYPGSHIGLIQKELNVYHLENESTT